MCLIFGQPEKDLLSLVLTFLHCPGFSGLGQSNLPPFQTTSFLSPVQVLFLPLPHPQTPALQPSALLFLCPLRFHLLTCPGPFSLSHANDVGLHHQLSQTLVPHIQSLPKQADLTLTLINLILRLIPLPLSLEVVPLMSYTATISKLKV